MFSHDLPGDRAAMKWDVFEKSVGTLSCGATSLGKIVTFSQRSISGLLPLDAKNHRFNAILLLSKVFQKPCFSLPVYKWVLDNVKVINSSLVL